MTSTNRFLNRLILLVVGVGVLGLAAVTALPLFPDAWESTRQWLTDALQSGASMIDANGTVALLIIAAVSVLVIAVSAIWIATRGRGRTSTAVEADDIVIDDAVVGSILRGRLDDQPDVLAVGAQGFRRAGGAVLVRVETRSRANLTTLLERIRSAVADTDRTIGAPVPLVIHLTTGVRTLASGSRTTR